MNWCEFRKASAAYFDTGIGRSLDSFDQLIVSRLKRERERRVNDATSDVNSNVHFENVTLLQNWSLMSSESK